MKTILAVALFLGSISAFGGEPETCPHWNPASCGFNPDSIHSSITICEGDGVDGHVRLEYHPVGPGQYEALHMTYGGKNVLEDPKSVFNHMGFIFFRGSHGIEFNLSEFSSEFSVTVPAFGGRLKTTEGQCRIGKVAPN